MPYFVASLITVVTAMVILFTRYEVDNSSIKSELERVRIMMKTIDSYVNTYIKIGEEISNIKFSSLKEKGIISDNIRGVEKTDYFKFNNSEIFWRIVSLDTKDSYRLDINIRKENILSSRRKFSENVIGRQYCERMLLGNYNKFENDSEWFFCRIYK